MVAAGSAPTGPGWGPPAADGWGEPTRADWADPPTVTQRAALPPAYPAPAAPPTRPQGPPRFPAEPPYPQDSPYQPPAVTQRAALPPAYQAPASSSARPQDPPPYPQDSPYQPPAAPGPAAFGQVPYGQDPREAQGSEPFGFYPPGGPQDGQSPTGSPSGPFGAPPRQPPRRHDRNRSGAPLGLWVAVLAVLVIGGTAAGVLLTRSSGHPSLRQAASSGGQPTASAGARTTPAGAATSPAASPSVSGPAVTQRQAAGSVAAMLGQSVSERAAITSAAKDVQSCGPGLAGDPKAFTDAAASRQKLLERLGAMPGRAALPPALLSNLTQAWQASVAADKAYARWASDELAKGCLVNDTKDPGFLATATPNQDATRYKTAFTSQWNPVAAKYGLTQYQQEQL